MSQRKFVKKSLWFAAAMALAAGGLLARPVPAEAIPPFPLAPECDKWTYPTQAFEMKQNNGIVVALFLNEDKFFNGPASHTVAGKPDVTGGSVTGNLQGRQIAFDVNWGNGTSYTYRGGIDDDGTARGSTLNNRNESNTWYSLAKFTCVPPPAAPAQPPPPPPAQQQAPPPPPAEPKPVEGPNVSFESVLGGLIAHITDRSGVASQCVYESGLVQRAFGLPAKSTFDLRIVPAVPQFRNWDVEVSCDNGALTKTSTFF